MRRKFVPSSIKRNLELIRDCIDDGKLFLERLNDHGFLRRELEFGARLKGIKDKKRQREIERKEKEERKEEEKREREEIEKREERRKEELRREEERRREEEKKEREEDKRIEEERKEEGKRERQEREKKEKEKGLIRILVPLFVGSVQSSPPFFQKFTNILLFAKTMHVSPFWLRH
ncbi:hypothetical protein LR48_Vigan07g144100 [Vigna angularis]|uniref:Uncharacterized protein n=1 Tax=Phaseolus angularis TaxID=3914 RepID=A0A0L9UYS3_PHAAN|nr:hypothetical protein LR48_Vigan07g144100 [Vigna angularis]